MSSLNVGNLDRALRLLIGLALVLLASAGTIAWWGYLGIVPLATGIAARCPLYSLLGVRTTTR